MTLIKSISGIRGTVGGAQAGNLTPPDVVKFTTAYARLAARRKAGKKLTIVVGRDARISGEMVADLVEGTLLACGADVINVGLCTTPGVEMAVITHKADGGIIITASHNPRQWNALKLLNADGEFLSDAEGKQVLAMAEEEDYEYPTVDGIGRVLSREPFNERHIAQVLALPLVDAQAIRAEIERAALEVYRAYSVRDLGRVDLIWDGGAARCFEVDVSPGMTERSLFPMACAAAGLSLPAVLDTLVNEAYARGACF